MHKKLIEILLKFTLSQITLLTIFISFTQISQYYFSETRYLALGPYLLQTSKIPQGLQCKKFYEQDQHSIYYLWRKQTPQQFMYKMQSFCWHHNKKFQVWLAIASLSIQLVTQMVGFITQNEIIFLIDYLMSFLLPHFTLIMDTISWGSDCIQQCLILQVFNLPTIPIVGFITFSILVVLTFMYMLLAVLEPNNLIKLFYSFLCSIFIAYVLIIDLISFISQGPDLLYLISIRFLILGLLLCMVYKIF